VQLISTSMVCFFCNHDSPPADHDFLVKISQPESSALNILAYPKRNMCNALRSKYDLC